MSHNPVSLVTIFCDDEHIVKTDARPLEGFEGQAILKIVIGASSVTIHGSDETIRRIIAAVASL
ncbi:MAG: hypothetical protein ACO395_07545 [Pontimonas sp.]